MIKNKWRVIEKKTKARGKTKQRQWGVGVRWGWGGWRISEGDMGENGGLPAGGVPMSRY